MSFVVLQLCIKKTTTLLAPRPPVGSLSADRIEEACRLKSPFSSVPLGQACVTLAGCLGVCVAPACSTSGWRIKKKKAGI